MSIESLQSIHSFEENLHCIECDNASSSWACTEHCIFICIDCAHTLKSQCGDLMKIKSLGMASWSSEEIAKLQHGGNSRFKAFLIQFGVPKSVPARQKYSCNAVRYYKELIVSEIHNSQPPSPPRFDEGFNLTPIAPNSFWGKTKNWIFSGKAKISEKIRENWTEGTIGKIRTTGATAICGLREMTCTMAQSAFSHTEEYSQPDYVRMEETPNKDNSR